MGAQTDKQETQVKKSRLDWLGRSWGTLLSWLQEVEMGVVWAISGVSLIMFIFTSIWYIDPALLTMVMQFQPATCTTIQSSFLVGITNCSWTSCRHGCTSEIFKCWHLEVNFSLVSGSRPIPPPWASLSSLTAVNGDAPAAVGNQSTKLARLYPNVKGCGYPPKLQCEDFFEEYGPVGTSFPCWVSHLDPEMALTELDLKTLKEEVMYSLLPLGLFILATLYALCRLGVFSICNPLRCCPRPPDAAGQAKLTPKQLFRYKKALLAKKTEELKQGHEEGPGQEEVPGDKEAEAAGDEVEPLSSSHNSHHQLSDDDEIIRQESEMMQAIKKPPTLLEEEEAEALTGESEDQLTEENFPDEIKLDLENLSNVLDQLDQIPYQQMRHPRRHKKNKVADHPNI